MPYHAKQRPGSGRNTQPGSDILIIRKLLFISKSLYMDIRIAKFNALIAVSGGRHDCVFPILSDVRLFFLSCRANQAQREAFHFSSFFHQARRLQHVPHGLPYR